MKQFLLELLLLVSISLILPKNILAANNLFGVHILFPEELKEASELVNSSGGDWGYVVIPIQSIDKNREKWQKFMDDCRTFHLIPIIRLATFPTGSVWSKPNEWDSLDFANFLNDLIWPTKKKIVAVYNEPNHAEEWGGEVNPYEYSDVLNDTIEQFKQKNSDFVILNAGLDASSPNSETSMDEYEFMRLMMIEQPDIFRKIDGFNAHSYPNPNFTISPTVDSRFSIKSYQHEINFLQDYYGIYGLKVYITETGWKINDYLKDETISEYFKTAYQDVWKDDYLQVVAPFLLKADAGDFINFSLIKKSVKSKSFEEIQRLKKIKGNPELEKNTSDTKNDSKNKYNNEKVSNPTLKFKSTWKKIIYWMFK
jgi:hypothetical protein